MFNNEEIQQKPFFFQKKILVNGAGAGAGCVEALAWTTPTERLKVLRQSRAAIGGNAVDTSLTAVLRESGVRGLYVGWWPTMLRQGSSVAVRFTVFSPVRDFLNNATGYVRTKYGLIPPPPPLPPH